ncbi:hypothetical protein [Kitasatospora sp. MAP5-34]|uniref:hypothetical protein n=1 Tax=Kitasatospora sp. MAP5-34 TaxID=3035102 RepID=UPI002473C295|nr:hypothetical protein [Kitasatospora sp. MAP5-34]
MRSGDQVHQEQPTAALRVFPCLPLLRHAPAGIDHRDPQPVGLGHHVRFDRQPGVRVVLVGAVEHGVRDHLGHQ